MIFINCDSYMKDYPGLNKGYSVCMSEDTSFTGEIISSGYFCIIILH